MASKMSAYVLAKKVTNAGKVKLTAPQVYRFMQGQRGLSLEVLDKVAAVVRIELKGYEEAAKKVKRA